METAKEQILSIESKLRMCIDDLPHVMRYATYEWLESLREDVQDFERGGPEPDWISYGRWINDICREDCMPALFVEPRV